MILIRTHKSLESCIDSKTGLYRGQDFEAGDGCDFGTLQEVGYLADFYKTTEESAERYSFTLYAEGV